jgi:hypothetical protein
MSSGLWPSPALKQASSSKCLFVEYNVKLLSVQVQDSKRDQERNSEVTFTECRFTDNIVVLFGYASSYTKRSNAVLADYDFNS